MNSVLSILSVKPADEQREGKEKRPRLEGERITNREWNGLDRVRAGVVVANDAATIKMTSSCEDGGSSLGSANDSGRSN